MGGGTTTIFLVCDSADANELRRAMIAAGAEVQASERRQFDGSEATSWAVIVTTAITSAPAILNSLTQFLRRNAVQSITAGDTTIVNPAPEHVEQLIAATRAR